MDDDDRKLLADDPELAKMFADDDDSDEDDLDDDFKPSSSTQRFSRAGSSRAPAGKGFERGVAGAGSFKRSSTRRSGRASIKRDPAEVQRLKRMRRAKANDRERNRYVRK